MSETESPAGHTTLHARSFLKWIRRRVRASEAAFIVLATLVGAGAGLLSVLQGAIARTLQHVLFGLSSARRLSALPALPPDALVVLPTCGISSAPGRGRQSRQPSVHRLPARSMRSKSSSVPIRRPHSPRGWPPRWPKRHRGARNCRNGRGAIGGLLLIPIALVSPQALSAGHGAPHADLALGASLAFIAMIFLAECAASTAGRMMRRDAKPLPAGIMIAEFRRRVPLGATSRTVLIDGEDRYAGIVQTPTAYAEGLDPQSPVGPLAINIDSALTPTMDIAEIMRRFDASGADETRRARRRPASARHLVGKFRQTTLRRGTRKGAARPVRRAVKHGVAKAGLATWHGVHRHQNQNRTPATRLIVVTSLPSARA